LIGPFREAGPEADLEPGSRTNERKTALAPYLDRLREEGLAGEQADSPLLPASFALAPWERSALEEGLHPEREARDDWTSLVAEGVALQTKFFAEFERIEREDAEGEQNDPDQIAFTAAIGLALMEETQRVVDALVLEGELGQAKRMSGFRNKIGQVVSRIKERTDQETFQRAQALSEEMTTPRQAQKLPRKKLEERDEGPPQQIKLDGARLPMGRIVAREEPRNRVVPLLVVMGAALLAWSILILPRAWRVSIPPLTLQDLGSSPAIQRVEAKPPSLFLIVDGSAWGRMERESREALVRRIGDSAGAAGYTGAVLRIDQGPIVAQWSSGRGARLIEPPRTGS
jgi:hypothetical protein